MPKNPLVMMLICGAVVAWQIYDMATAIEAPNQWVEILNWFCLIGAGIGFVGGGIQLAAQKSGGG